MIRNQKGYTFLEMMTVVVILGIVAAASMTYLRGSTITVVGHMVQIAMTNLASEEVNLKYPASVTLADLESHGVSSSLLEDYTIDSYARIGTPAGKDYKLEIKSGDGTILCLTETTLTKAACP